MVLWFWNHLLWRLMVNCKWRVHYLMVYANCGCVSLASLAKNLYFLQNAEGSGLAPFDCWICLRGIKTMALRVEKQQVHLQSWFCAASCCIIGKLFWEVFLTQNISAQVLCFPSQCTTLFIEIGNQMSASQLLWLVWVLEECKERWISLKDKIEFDSGFFILRFFLGGGSSQQTCAMPCCLGGCVYRFIFR